MPEEKSYSLVLGIFGNVEDIGKWFVSVQRYPTLDYSELTKEEIRDSNEYIPISKVMPMKLEGVDSIELHFPKEFKFENLGHLKPNEFFSRLLELAEERGERDIKHKIIEPLDKNFKKIFIDYEGIGN